MSTPAVDIRQLVVRRRDACVQFKDGQPSKDRKEALQFYNGTNLDLYGDSGDGLSTVVSRDTMEAIESMMPPLLRPFVAGEEVVSFDPIEQQDEEGAKQATEYVNHVFRRHNNVLSVAQSALKDGLLFRLGIAKTVMEEVEDGAPETYEGVTQEEFDTLTPDELAGPAQQDPTTLLYTVTLKPPKVPRFRVHIVAPDEFLYEERLASLEDATFLGHARQITLGDLIAMGRDRPDFEEWERKCKALRSGKPGEVADERFRDEDEPSDELKTDDLARKVYIDECYIKCDKDGLGVLSWRKTMLGGAQSDLLLDEPAEDHPYSTWTPIPIPHKLVGLSIHDLTRDVQMQKTALQREMLNNLYLVNRPQRAVVDGQVNVDDLMQPAINGVVRVKSQGAIEQLVTPFVAAQTFQMVEYQDSVREARTGVTRYNQGMDSSSLNKTATGMNIIASNSQQRQELVARQFGEFLKDVFQKLFALVKQHADAEDVQRLLGDKAQFTGWISDYDMTVTVGLGSNNKDQLIGHYMGLVQIQKEIIQMQGGVQGPLVTGENVHALLTKITEAMGLKGGDRYFSDPADQEALPPPEQQQDPLAEARLKAETELGKAHIQQQTELTKEQMRQQVVPINAGVSL